MAVKSMDEIVSFAKAQGFVFQGSEIYGGLANTWDYGPLGVELKNNIKKAWWKKFVTEDFNNVGLDASILMNPKTWVASGHLGGFSDPLTDCKGCHSRYRADKLIEDFDGTIADGFSDEQMMDYIYEHNIVCPKCGKLDYTPIRKFNLMFKTQQGVIDDEGSTVYFRPETAQGVFVNYKNVQRSMRKKLPFGIGQIGKSFRNEITPGQFIFRTREFEQMEMEFFCKPGTELEWYNYYKQFCINWLYSLGITPENLRTRDHEAEELSFYSNATVDLEYKFPFGFGELWGIASRTNYDLTQHQNVSGVNMEYLDPDTNEKYIPYVVEPSVGVERLFLAFMCDAYHEEEVGEGDVRQVLKLHPALAPYKVSVLPLIKKIHGEKAKEVYAQLAKYFSVSYDDAGKIGKRYRRQDAIGTCYSVTIDDNTLENNTVTVRDRDTMEQITISLDELVNYINEKIYF